MKKGITIALIAAVILLLISCGANETEAGTQKRFVSSDPGVGMITDTKTGCEYIKSGGYTSWTYVHGSCPEIIAKESGK